MEMGGGLAIKKFMFISTCKQYITVNILNIDHFKLQIFLLNSQVKLKTRKIGGLQGIESGSLSKHFMAFGGGMRFCVGTDFTKIQMAVFLHCLVTKYRYVSIGCLWNRERIRS